MLRDVISGTMNIVNFFPSRSSGSTQRKILARQMQVFLKHRDHHIVIFTLRQPGNGDRAYATSARQKNRKAPAVRSVVFGIKPRFCLQSGLSTLVRQADGVGTAVVALDDIAFAANPVRVVGCGSRHGVRKQLMSVEMDINRYRDATFFGCGLQGAAHGPRRYGIELFELQAFFLLRDLFEILI